MSTARGGSLPAGPGHDTGTAHRPHCTVSWPTRYPGRTTARPGREAPGLPRSQRWSGEVYPLLASYQLTGHAPRALLDRLLSQLDS
ncbi:hypothetical protein IL38_23775 [Actinopolyspora erythraea]|uniref:Uncharacterized protein n=1 Tax=Actinopolyspora erythraea TaxID=414996 RepID=A0ABR4WYF9_9ACTN|nr:hypothetical protein [Actinopolyspora erythraea]KGI79332.1 hypothetical protein IL38_23775 [Actinopolyspora erythraea]